MLDELAKLIQDKATSLEDAFSKMQWVQEWIKMQNRSPTPKQLFDDWDGKKNLHNYYWPPLPLCLTFAR